MCDHKQYVMEEVTYYDEDMQPYTVTEGCMKDTFVDIDLHRYRCTQCKKVFYYSEMARSHYENGTDLWKIG